ncbi:putative armadillo-like helical protein [Plasmopara halstedii]
MRSSPDHKMPSQHTASVLSDSSYESFHKLFASVADPQTMRNHRRHLALAKYILYENEAGWKIAQLPLVGELFQLLQSKILNGAPQFADQLVCAVTNCCKPLIRQKSNEEIINPSLFYRFLPSLGELLSFKNIEVQVAAAEALKYFATGACLVRTVPNDTESQSDDSRLTPRTISQDLLFETGSAELIVAVIHELFPDSKFGEKEHESEVTTEDLKLNGDQTCAHAQCLSAEQGKSLVCNAKVDAGSNMDMEGNNSQAVKNNVGETDLAFENDHMDAGIIQNQTAQAYDHNYFYKYKRNRHWKSEGNIMNERLQCPPQATRPTSAPTYFNGERGIQAETGHERRTLTNFYMTTASTQDEIKERPQSAQEKQCAQDFLEQKFVLEIKDGLSLQLRLSELLFPLIDLLNELSAHQRCVEVLVVRGVLSYIVLLLENVRSSQDELLPICLEILWNVLELSRDLRLTITTVNSRKELLEFFRLKDASFSLGNIKTFQALHHVIEILLARGYRQQDKAIRNECLMVLFLLAKRRYNLGYFHSTGLTVCLLSYASAELSQANTPTKLSFLHGHSSATIVASKQNYTTDSDEDFEFKQMLWFLLAEISFDHEANLKELVTFRCIDMWLSYATITYHRETVQASSPASSIFQLQILQRLAQNLLNFVVPCVVDHFYQIGGHIRLLSFLQLNMGTAEILASTWLLLLQISRPLPYFQSELGQLGAIECALGVFEAPASHHTCNIRRNAILACACMCRNDDGSNRERFRRANGIYTLVQHLEDYPSYSGLEENFLVGVLDAVRSCVIGDIQSETAFINYDGVSKLLSIVQIAPKALKNQALAALAEICVNPAAIPSYEIWRCDQPGEMKNASANEVLLRLYADEEAAEISASQKQNIAIDCGVDAAALTNVYHYVSQVDTCCKLPAVTATEGNILSESLRLSLHRPESPAFSRLKDALTAAQRLTQERRFGNVYASSENNNFDFEVNLKPKIYAVMANTSFSYHSKNLSPNDQVIFESVKGYPTSKFEELWQNVVSALHAEGVRPIYADALYIRKKIKQAYDISLCTKLTQHEISQQSHCRKLNDELAFYAEFLRQKHQEAEAEDFQRANRLQSSTMKRHLDAKKTQVECMLQQNSAALALHVD